MAHLTRVFSSAANLDEADEVFQLPKEIEKVDHVFDEGYDCFDEQHRPIVPPAQTLKKNFSGSMLDLDGLDSAVAAAELDQQQQQQQQQQQGSSSASGAGCLAGAGSGINNNNNNNSTNSSTSSPSTTPGSQGTSRPAFSGGASSSANTSFGTSTTGGTKGVVALLGGSLYLNGHIIGMLLEKGYTVHAFLQGEETSRPSGKTVSELHAIGATNNNNSNNSSSNSLTSNSLTTASGGGTTTPSPSTTPSFITPQQSSGDLTSSSSSSSSTNSQQQQQQQQQLQHPSTAFSASASTSPTSPLKRERRLIVESVDMFDQEKLERAFARCNARFVIHGGVTTSSPQQTTATTSTAGAGTSAQSSIEHNRQAVNALFAAVKSSKLNRSIERVIITSSMSCVVPSATSSSSSSSSSNPTSFDETSKNDKATAAEEPLVYAKIQFENQAIKLQRSSAVELTILIPSIMLGPSRTTESSDAVRLVCDFAKSSSFFPFAPNMYWNFVDVRDVALAHVLAIEQQKASSSSSSVRRYIVSNNILSLADVGCLIREANSKLKAPIYNMPLPVAMLSPLFSGSRVRFSYLWNNLGVRRPLKNDLAVKELGLKFRPMTESVKDCVKELSDQGLLPEATGEVSADWEATKITTFALVVSAVVGVGIAWLWKRRRQQQK